MNYLNAARNYFTPVLTESQFHKGRLTPEQFVEAGDNLVFKCPTWAWQSGEKSKRVSYLPADKQYLVTRNVPCLYRCEDEKNRVLEQTEEDWTIYSNTEKVQQNIIVDITDVDTQPHQKAESDEMDDVISIDGDSDVEDIAVSRKSKILKTRTYNVYISYDNYYRTPRVWLYGFDERGHPLNQKEMFQDISSTHKKKTVTYEFHPHENHNALSVHPCKHSDTMKGLIERSDTDILRPDQYMFLFLKFIGTVIPTITYDFSIAM